MYLEFYGLRKEPFHIAPDPEFLYLSPSHREALGAIIYNVEKRMGFVAVTGGVGLGKTTILRTFLEQVDKDKLVPVFVFNPNVSFKGLLKTIFHEMGLDIPDTEEDFELVQFFHKALIDEYARGRNVVLIIDEAQNMPVGTLENLRMLTNLETPKEKLLQIVLVGQPELEDKLNLRELRQLKQRLVAHARIVPFTPSQSLDYIKHRLSRASKYNTPIFTKGALKQIIRYCKGIPRKINIVCDNALITGYGYMKNPIASNIVKEVIADFEGKKTRSLKRQAFAAGTILLLLAGIWLASLGKDMSLDLYGRYFKQSSNTQADSQPSLMAAIPAPGKDASQAHPRVNAAIPGRTASLKDNSQSKMQETSSSASNSQAGNEAADSKGEKTILAAADNKAPEADQGEPRVELEPADTRKKSLPDQVVSVEPKPSSTESSEHVANSSTLGPSIKVTSPVGGEVWYAGDSADITWVPARADSAVKIEFSRDGGGTWQSIASSAPNTGSFAWNVTSPGSNNCRIRVSSLETPSLADTNSTSFTTKQRNITILTPNGDEIWDRGLGQDIRWTSDGAGEAVMIELSRDGGTSWEPITSSASNMGTYHWVAASLPSTKCRIRVSSIAYPKVKSTSKNDFSLLPYHCVVIKSPASGQVWYLGSIQRIRWLAHNAGTRLKIELSRDGGVSWETISTTTPNAGFLKYKVTSPPSTNCRIRLSTDYPQVFDTGDGRFVIKQGTVKLSSPQGGEIWRIGETKTIRWKSESGGRSMRLEISRDGGNSWSTIVRSVPNSGSYNWNVTEPVSPRCRIRVRSGDRSVIPDMSDSDFVITAEP